MGHAVAGSAGSAIANVLTYPLSFIVTRLQVQRQLPERRKDGKAEQYTSLYDAAEKIYTHGKGLRGLFLGVEPDTAKTIADSFLFFLSYTFLRNSRVRSKTHSNHLSVIDELSVGFVAGAFSKFLTTPLSNIVTRKQTASAKDKHKNQMTVKAIAKQIYEEKGLQGFWAGYSASLILTLNPSLTFFFFETFKKLLLTRERRISPTARATFLFAALSKAMASTITFPFSLAKTRLQVSGKLKEGRSNSEATARSRSAGIFDVFRIAKAEGLEGLYAGLGGEILKGFFSHGITMLSKQIVHRVVIQLYYMILKILRRYPKPLSVAKSATGHVKATVRSTAQTISTGG